jgi:MOSC domain-containing protein YiiM
MINHVPHILAVCVTHALIPDTLGSLEYTGIDKRPQRGRVPVAPLGLAGDVQFDTKNHGGTDQAVYAYAREDALWWESEIGRAIPAGGFGENLTTEGLDLGDAVVGESWRVGSALLQVRGPRIPCRTLQGFWDVPQLVKRFTERGRPGAYLGVLESGDIGAGDAIEVVDRPGHGLTIGQLFRALTIGPELLPRVAECPDVPAGLRERAARRLAPAEPG